MDLLLERGPIAGVQHIRLQDALNAVGLTTGAAYAIWADQEEFHRELATELVRTWDETSTLGLVTSVGDVTVLDEMIRRAGANYARTTGAWREEDEAPAPALYLTALALRTAAGAWPELREASVARHEQSVTRFSEAYAHLLELSGTRMREPFTVRDLAEALAALAEGFAVRSAERLEQPTFTLPDFSGAQNEWTLFAVAARGLVTAFTDHTPGDAGA